MIQDFVDSLIGQEKVVKERFAQKHPENYADLVRLVVECITQDQDWDVPDPGRVHQIDDGGYQGTLVFVIGAKGYQPSDYWYVKVSYGSCSGCDTLEGIREYSDDPPTEVQVNDYWSLALHIVQGISPMGEHADL